MADTSSQSGVNLGNLLVAGAGAATNIIGTNNATNALVGGEQNAINTQANTQNQLTGIFGNQRALGNSADTALSSQLGLNGSKPDYSAFNNSPGFQFALGQGNQAIDRTAAANGNLYTPNTLAMLSQYNTGYASQNYNNYISQLMQSAGLGAQGNAGLATGITSTGANISQLQQNQGNANASGAAGTASAIGGLLNNPTVTGAVSNLFGGSGVTGSSAGALVGGLQGELGASTGAAESGVASGVAASNSAALGSGAAGASTIGSAGNDAFLSQLTSDATAGGTSAGGGAGTALGGAAGGIGSAAGAGGSAGSLLGAGAPGTFATGDAAAGSAGASGASAGVAAAALPVAFAALAAYGIGQAASAEKQNNAGNLLYKSFMQNSGYTSKIINPPTAQQASAVAQGGFAAVGANYQPKTVVYDKSGHPLSDAELQLQMVQYAQSKGLPTGNFNLTPAQLQNIISTGGNGSQVVGG